MSDHPAILASGNCRTATRMPRSTSARPLWTAWKATDAEFRVRSVLARHTDPSTPRRTP